MPMVTLHKMGSGNVYHLHVLDAVDPGYGGGLGGGVDPGYGHGGVMPPHVGNRPPGSGRPNFPDNSLPSGPPPHVPDGTVVVLVKDPAGVWHYASLPPGTPAPTPLPEQPAPTPT